MKGVLFTLWKYNSPIGTMYIKYLPNEQRHGLFYKNVCWETCDTPQAEADNVYMHCIGCFQWDILAGRVPNCPTDLSGWEKL